jgi:alkylation response protein AidB-like acyl-CoA dehydrogenase
MNFDLSDEQSLLQATVRQFLEKECPPERRRALFEAEQGFDPVLWKGMIELGLGGIQLPEEHGGLGLELLDLALVAEELGRHAAPGPFLGHALAGLAIARAGSEEQRRRWLPKLATGAALGTVALAEAGGAWLPEEWTLAGGDTLDGAKAHVPFADVADLLVVGVAGGGLAVVEREATGVAIEVEDGVDRTRRLSRVRFERARAELLAAGAPAAPRLRDAGLVLLAADAWGGASRCVEMAVDHAKTRRQFGVAIGSFQALKHQLANLAVEVEPVRALVWWAAHAFDRAPAEAERAAALAKAHASERFVQVARDTVEAHGGIGFTWECDVQIWFKRVMFDRLWLGAPELHRERYAALEGW